MENKIERRDALRTMGMSLGFMLAAPTFVSLLQGCNTNTGTTWEPKFLNSDQGTVLKQVVDAILPKTDTLSASEVNVHVFLDSFANEVMGKKQQDQFAKTLDLLTTKALDTSGEKSIDKLTPEDLAPVLIASLKDGADDQLQYVSKMRDLTIWGYKCTEYVGEEVLAYLPVPGQYIPCGDLEVLTEGKAWSL